VAEAVEAARKHGCLPFIHLLLQRYQTGKDVPMQRTVHRFAALVGLSVWFAATGLNAQSLSALEADVRRPKPYVVWMLESLGLFGFLSMAAGLAVFLGACLVVALARRPAVTASFMAFLPLPLLLGAAGAVKGFVSAFTVVARSDVALRSSEVAAIVSEALLPLLGALMETIPSCLVLATGLFLRTLLADRRPPSRVGKPE